MIRNDDYFEIIKEQNKELAKFRPFKSAYEMKQEIKRLNKERENDIKYNKYLQKELAKSNNIIKEVREYMNKNEIEEVYLDCKLYETRAYKDILDILEKER